jgi:predicted metal-dependent peptidase
MSLASTLTFEQLLAAGRHRLCRTLPYLESIVLWLVPRESEHTLTMGVSANGILHINRDFVMRQTPLGVAVLLGHEALHVYLDTHGRAARIGSSLATVRLASLAADCVINVILRDAGLLTTAVVGGGIMPADFGFPEGLMMEEYYVRLAGHLHEKKGCMHGDCTLPADEDDPHGRSTLSRERARRQAALSVRSTPGMAHEALQRVADELLTPPRVPWETKLAHVVRHCVSYRPGRHVRYDGRGRKQCAVGYGAGRSILPRYLGGQAKVEVWLDTSGSMSDSNLAQGLIELPAILSLVGGEVLFGVIDTTIHALVPVRSVDEARACLRGGGGTDFSALFDRLVGLRVDTRPDLVILTTDGEAFGVPETPPPCPVLWLCVRGGRPPCRWGEVIDLDGA